MAGEQICLWKQKLLTKAWSGKCDLKTDMQRLDQIKKEMAIEGYNVEEEFYKEFD